MQEVDRGNSSGSVGLDQYAAEHLGTQQNTGARRLSAPMQIFPRQLERAAKEQRTDPCLLRARAPAYFLLLASAYEQTHKAQGVLADVVWYAKALGRIVVEPAVQVGPNITKSIPTPPPHCVRWHSLTCIHPSPAPDICRALPAAELAYHCAMGETVAWTLSLTLLDN